MNTAIVTLCVGKDYTELSKITHPLFIKYANKTNSEFIIFNEITPYQNIMYKKFDVNSILQAFERVLFIDSDIIIKNKAENLFQVVPETHIGMMNEAKLVKENHFKDPLLNYQEAYTSEKNGKIHPDDRIKYTQLDFTQYYNAGLFLVSRRHGGPLFRNIIKEINNWFSEQTLLNLRIQTLKIPVFELDIKYNCVPWACKNKDFKNKPEAQFLHYAAVKNRIERMKKDYSFLQNNREV